MTRAALNKLLDKLLDVRLEFDEVDLSKATPEELLFCLKFLRANYLMRVSVAKTLGEQLTLLTMFARPVIDQAFGKGEDQEL